MNAFPVSEIDQLNGRGGISSRLFVAALMLPQLAAQAGTSAVTSDVASKALAFADALIAAEGG